MGVAAPRAPVGDWGPTPSKVLPWVLVYWKTAKFTEQLPSLLDNCYLEKRVSQGNRDEPPPLYINMNTAKNEQNCTYISVRDTRKINFTEKPKAFAFFNIFT